MSQPASSSRNHERALRVLIVDDSRDAVQTLGILFRSEGMEVRMVEAATEALPAALDFRPDVVLLDIGMPEQNGYEVAEELRKRFGRDHPKLIAVTGHKGLADKCQARQSGFDHYVTKPYNPVSLLKFIGSFGPKIVLR